MNARVLPILNAIGCLVLTGLVGVQWIKERALNGDIHGLKRELAAARQQAAESSAESLAAKEQLAGQLQTDLDAARQQVTAWEQALKQRDERLTRLFTDLDATRKRLEEAIAKLKEAGAR